MSRHRDLTGQRFERLTVIQRSERKQSSSGTYYWLCKCDCGNHLLCRTDNLTSGHTRQCSRCSPAGGATSVFVEGVAEDGVV